MKSIKSYIMGLATLGVMLTGCSTEFDDLPVNIPEATLTPNTTILELKTQFWDDASNYIWNTPNQADAVPQTIPAREDGSHYIIHGRVVSSDEEGNVFKSLTIQDETAALAFSINSYDLYVQYRRGQEIVVDATGMKIGKYNGLQQMGEAEWYANGNAWEASFMPIEVFKGHIELNGLPEVAKLDTLELSSFSQLPSDPEGLRQYQSQLVRFNNVKFVDGGKEKFSEYQSSGVDRQIEDAEGSTLKVRTSGYCDFWNNTLPEGNGDIVVLMGYYGTSGWQLTLIDYAGCMNFGNPTIGPGAKDNPYTVEQAIAAQAIGKNPTGWVTGYIVGTVAIGKSEISSSEDIQFSNDPDLDNTLVIGPTPDCTDVAKCLVMSLPADTKIRQYAAIANNPDVYKKQIWVYGKFAEFMGTYGITGNSGGIDQFSIEGVEIGGSAIANGDGTQAAPYNCTQVIAKNPDSTTEAVESGVWVSGYIVGYMPTGGSSTLLSGTVFAADADAAATNLVIGPTADCTDVSKCVGVQLPTTMRDALALANKPGNLGSKLSIKGDIMKYCGGPGVKNLTEYSLDGAGSGETPTQPTESVIYSALSEDDAELTTGWTIDNVSLGSVSEIWTWKTYNGKSYLNGSAYQTTSTAESWAISPVIDLTGATAPSLSFDHAAKFQTTLLEVCGVYARVEGATTWTKLTIPTWPTAGAWTFVNSGAVSMGDFAGKKVQVAFKYVGNTTGADTWEIKNLKVIGTGGTAGGNTGGEENPGGGDNPGGNPGGDTPGEGGTTQILATAITSVPGTSTVDGYTITIQKNAGTTNPASHAGTSAIRLYAKNSIEIAGATMTKIVFTLASDAGYRYTTVTPSTGTISPAQAEGDTSFTWIGESNDVTFTVGDNATLGSEGASKAGQIRFSAIDITSK